MERKKVFISSVMRIELEDLSAERAAVIEAIDSYPFLFAWAFEREPASSDDIETSFLRHVDDSALCVFVIGSELTEPVEKEFERAQDREKDILIFRKNVSKRSQGAESLLGRAGVKYQTFGSIEELRKELIRALNEHIGRLLSQKPEPFDYQGGYSRRKMQDASPKIPPGSVVSFNQSGGITAGEGKGAVAPPPDFVLTLTFLEQPSPHK